MTVYLMSTTILTDTGVWTATSVNAAQAYYALCKGGSPNFISAVGHQATAKMIERLLEPPMAGFEALKIEAARLTVCAQVGDIFVCFKLKQRPPEGAILGLDELRNLAHEWVIMTLVAESLEALTKTIVDKHDAAIQQQAQRAQAEALRIQAEAAERAALLRHGRKPAIEPRSFMGGHRD